MNIADFFENRLDKLETFAYIDIERKGLLYQAFSITKEQALRFLHGERK